MLHKSLRVHEPHPVYPSPPRDWTFFPLSLLFLFSSSSLFLYSLSSLDSHPRSILFLILISFLYTSPILAAALHRRSGFLIFDPLSRVIDPSTYVLSIPLLGPSPCHTACSTSSGDHRVFILTDSSIASSFLCPSSLFFVSILRFLAAILFGLGFWVSVIDRLVRFSTSDLIHHRC